MVRATYAEVVKLNGGVDPVGWDSTSIGHLCTQWDAMLDGRATPSTFGTGVNETFFANFGVYRWIVYNTWAGGGAQPPAPPMWDDFLEDWFQRLLTSTTHDAIKTIASQE